MTEVFGKVTLLGKEAAITSIRGDIGKDYRHDKIRVVLDFTTGDMEGVKGCCIGLPLMRYTRDEFLTTVQREGERHLKAIIAKLQVGRLKKDRQMQLDRVVANIKFELSDPVPTTSKP